MLTILIPKNSQIKVLSQAEVEKSLKNKDPSQYNDVIDSFSDNYHANEKLWTPELEKLVIEKGQLLFNQPMIYNTVNEFVFEHQLLKTLNPQSASVPPIDQATLHQLLHGKSPSEIPQVMALLSKNYHLIDELWSEADRKSSIILGRLLKLMANPSISELIYRNANKTLVGNNADGSTEEYWMEIINDYTKIKNYDETLTEWTQTNQPKVDPIKSKKITSQKKQDEIKINLKPLPKEIIKSKIIPDLTYSEENYSVVELTDGLKKWAQVIPTKQYQILLDKEQSIQNNPGNYEFEPPELKNLFISDEILKKIIWVMDPVTYKIQSTMKDDVSGKYLINLTNGIENWDTLWTPQQYQEAVEKEKEIVKNPGLFEYQPDEVAQLFLSVKTLQKGLTPVPIVAIHHPKDPLPSQSADLTPLIQKSAELVCETETQCQKLLRKYQSERQVIYQLPDGDKKTMGANLLYDIKSKKYAVDPSNWWFSEKYDGVRAVWTGQKLLTRNGKVINAPQWFLNLLPNDMALDGELYLGRKTFNQVQGVATTIIPDESVWKKLKYLIYDIPDSLDIFENRIKLLNYYLKGDIVRSVPHIKIKNMDHFLQIHIDLVKEDAEGSMIRRPASLYQYGHSNALLKFK